jgi:hypothetical protein
MMSMYIYCPFCGMEKPTKEHVAACFKAKWGEPEEQRAARKTAKCSINRSDQS